MATQPTPADPQPRRRPPAWFFLVIAGLVLAGIAAPVGVGVMIRHQASIAPRDTTGNRPDSARPRPLVPDSATRSP